MNVEQLRAELYRLEHDEHLTQTEVEAVRIQTLGVLNNRPRTVGEAKRYINALKAAIHNATVEIPL